MRLRARESTPAAAEVKVPLQQGDGLADALGEGLGQLLTEPALWQEVSAEALLRLLGTNGGLHLPSSDLGRHRQEVFVRLPTGTALIQVCDRSFGPIGSLCSATIGRTDTAPGSRDVSS
jgi:hypothetical protein